MVQRELIATKEAVEANEEGVLERFAAANDELELVEVLMAHVFDYYLYRPSWK